MAVLATHLVSLSWRPASRTLTWVWSCHMTYIKHVPRKHHLASKSQVIVWQRVVLLTGSLDKAPVPLSASGELLPPALSPQKVPLELGPRRLQQSNRPAEWAHLCSVVYLKIGPLWLLMGHFSSRFMITKDNQGSWKPGIFVPFTLFGPQVLKTLSQCPRGPVPFRENV